MTFLSKDTIMMFLEIGMIILVMGSLSIIIYGILSGSKPLVKIAWVASGIFGLFLMGWAHDVWLSMLRDFN